MNSIRKVQSGGLKPSYGPATAGIYVDSDGAVVVNASGTELKVSLEDASLPLNANLGAAAQAIIIADAAYKVVKVQSVVAVGVSGATAQIRKTSGTTAPGSGVVTTASAIDLNTTANTVVDNALTATAADLTLAVGDRLWFIPSTGTLTGLSGGITVTLRRV